MSRRSATAEQTGGRFLAKGRWIPFAVVATIAAFVILPVLHLTRSGSHDLGAVRLRGSLPPPPRIPPSWRVPAEANPHVRALILYDSSGRWGWLGELDATLTANLASHFGRWKAEPVADYKRGEIERYTALLYLGTTFGAPLPRAFLDDVLRTRHPVVWVNENIWQLEKRAGDFRRLFGWQTSSFDRTAVPTVRYKGTSLTRWPHQSDGIMGYANVDPRRVRVLARAVRANGSSFPWAVRSRNLTYIGEIPFTYTSETDRVLVFDDLLFDALAPRTRERHRALLRLEDINPRSDPAQLRAAADYLHQEHIPFGFGVSPYYRDPRHNEDAPYELHLRQAPQLVAALKYLERKGGVLVEHGYTHQWDGGPNPYDGITGDDYEFFRVTSKKSGQLQQLGPLPQDDSVAWTERRIVAANREFAATGLAAPHIFEFPHYTASDFDYKAAAKRFGVRWERGVYVGGLLGGGSIQYRHAEGQIFPYVVEDVYGSKVLPENLGSISPTRWHTFKAHLPRDIVRAAHANLVVRDGFASFYFHPYLDLNYLKRAVKGVEAEGYTFVSPASLARGPAPG